MKKMKKIPSLFKRDYEGDRLVYDAVIEGSEWVIEGEGIATEKMDGTCCMVRYGILYKRRDRNINKKTGEHKPAPDGWESAQDPDPITGHWPGWLAVGDGPEDKWHREAFEGDENFLDGTFELVGPKVQGNPYDYDEHILLLHGSTELYPKPIRHFLHIKEYLKTNPIEGIVWHHPDGRMVKIKRKDFGFLWPYKSAYENGELK